MLKFTTVLSVIVFGLLVTAQTRTNTLLENINAIAKQNPNTKPYTLNEVATLVLSPSETPALNAPNLLLFVPTDDAIDTYIRNLGIPIPPALRKLIMILLMPYHLATSKAELARLISDTTQTITLPTHYIPSGNALGPNNLTQVLGVSKDSNGLLLSFGLSTVRIIDTIVSANGCYLYVIDSVLQMPSSVALTINALRLDKFSQILEKAGFISKVNQLRGVTIFAPNDKALSQFDITHHTTDQLKKIVDAHIVPSVIYELGLTNSDLTTLNRTTIKVHVNKQHILVDTATVVQANVFTNTGVIHVVDAMLSGSAARLSGLALAVVVISACIFGI